jgi:hypothetical protein
MNNQQASSSNGGQHSNLNSGFHSRRGWPIHSARNNMNHKLLLATISVLTFSFGGDSFAADSGSKQIIFPNTIGGRTIQIQGGVTPASETLVFDASKNLLGRFVTYSNGSNTITTFYKGTDQLSITDKHVTNADGSQMHEIYNHGGQLEVRTNIPSDRAKEPTVQNSGGQPIDASVGQKFMEFPTLLITQSQKAEQAGDGDGE